MTTVGPITIEDAKILLLLDKIARGYPDYPAGGIPQPQLFDPNYVIPSQGPAILGVTCALIPPAVGIVCLRVYVNKYWPGLSIGWDDITIIPATVSNCFIRF
jgi:hypothetical protein